MSANRTLQNTNTSQIDLIWSFLAENITEYFDDDREKVLVARLKSEFGLSRKSDLHPEEKLTGVWHEVMEEAEKEVAQLKEKDEPDKRKKVEELNTLLNEIQNMGLYGGGLNEKKNLISEIKNKETLFGKELQDKVELFTQQLKKWNWKKITELCRNYLVHYEYPSDKAKRIANFFLAPLFNEALNDLFVIFDVTANKNLQEYDKDEIEEFKEKNTVKNKEREIRNEVYAALNLSGINMSDNNYDALEKNKSLQDVIVEAYAYYQLGIKKMRAINEHGMSATLKFIQKLCESHLHSNQEKIKEETRCYLRGEGEYAATLCQAWNLGASGYSKKSRTGFMYDSGIFTLFKSNGQRFSMFDEEKRKEIADQIKQAPTPRHL